MVKEFLKMIGYFWLNIFLYIWQLPQNIIGIIWLNINLIFFYGIKHIKTIGENTYVYEILTRNESVSLGKYIIVSENSDELTIQHEYGHCIQSKYLEPLYLIIIGIPSIIWSCIYKWFKKDYYWFYTEKWADKLVNIKR